MPIASDCLVPPATRWWLRLHAAVMPDYNRKATLYWCLLSGAGLVALAAALLQVARLPMDALAQVLIGGTIAMLAGLFPVRVPGSKNSFAAGEIFIFLLLLMHGPAAGAVAAAAFARGLPLRRMASRNVSHGRAFTTSSRVSPARRASSSTVIPWCAWIKGMIVSA